MVDDSTTRRRLLATTGTAAAAGLAGCLGFGGGGDSGTQEVHVFTDYNNDAWQQKWEQDIKPAFKEDTGYDLRMEYAGFSGQNEDRLATLIQSGDPPAVQTSTFEQVGDSWSSGLLEPLTDVVSAAESNVGEMLSPPFQTPEGDYYEVPHGYYTSVLHYREDVYEELGLDVPSTFQELKENARIIDESDMDIRGYGLAGKKVGKSQDEFQVFLANMGVSELRPKDVDADVPEAELWFPKDEMITLLEYFQDLAQYSPDPTGIGWGESLKGWVSGSYAQMYNLNMWPAGVAAGTNDKIANNTGVTHLPLWEEGGIAREDSWLAAPTPDGHHVFSGSDNPEGGKALLEWLYGSDPERTANLYRSEPTRFLPDYADVLSTDTFQSYDHFQNYPEHLEKLKKVQNEITADYYGNVEAARVVTNAPEWLYYYRFFFIGEMMNQVLTGTDPETAWADTKETAKQRLKEGKEKLRN